MLFSPEVHFVCKGYCKSIGYIAVGQHGTIKVIFQIWGVEDTERDRWDVLLGFAEPCFLGHGRYVGSVLQ